MEGTGSMVKSQDYRPARRVILDALGREAIARFHRPIPVLDWLAVIALPLVFAGNAVVLATASGWPWTVALVLQGCVLHTFGYVVHDLFVHRRVGGRAGYYIGVVFELPLTIRRTWYAQYHLDHHALMNTDDDPEAYKQDLDTRWKRVFFLTLPGALLGMSRRLKPVAAASPHIVAGPLTPPTDGRVRRQLSFERALAGVWMLIVAAVLVWWWPLAMYGYLVPFALVLPVVSCVRMLLEHSECDPGNVFHCAMFYRTGWITGPLFFWDAGDCHIVHHIYPGIPFYRMPAAVAAMVPVLRQQGARERRSLLGIFRGWFWRNEPHRAVWSA